MVEVITCLKNTGMSIDQIKGYIDLFRHGAETYKDRVALFELQKAKLEMKINELKEELDLTEYKIWYYQNVETLGNTKDPENCAKMKDLYNQTVKKKR